jgi:hypothetical protein
MDPRWNDRTRNAGPLIGGGQIKTDSLLAGILWLSNWAIIRYMVEEIDSLTSVVLFRP